jgi:hypothetical protein
VVVGLLDENQDLASGDAMGTGDTGGDSGTPDADVDTDTDVDADDGCAWRPIYDTPTPMLDVWGWGASTNSVYAAGGNEDNSGGGLIYNFSGTTGKWTAITPDPEFDVSFATINGLWGTPDTNNNADGARYDLFMAHNNGVGRATVTKLRPEGLAWAEEVDTTSVYNPTGGDEGVSSPFKSVWGSSDTDMFAVGGTSPLTGFAETKVVHYDGATWADMTVPSLGMFTRVYMTDVWGSGPDDVYGVTGVGYILHYNGTEWENVYYGSQTGSAYAFQAVWGRSADEVYAVGTVPSLFGPLNGLVMRWDGNEWSRIEFEGLLERTTLTGIWGRANTEELFIIGSRDNKGVMFQYLEGQWIEVLYWSGNENESYQYKLNNLWGDKKGNLFVVSDRGIFTCLTTRRFPM